MGVFDNFWEETKDYEKNNKVQMVEFAVADNPAFNLSILKQNIDHIDDMDDRELRLFISRSFQSIMTNLFQSNEAYKYIKYFQDARFLDAFIDVVNSIPFMDRADVIRCNTICYHYLTMPKDKQDQLILNRMMLLSRIINKNNLSRLLGLGLSENLASMLLIARYSDLDMNVCVKRVDFIIITQPKELMSEKMIEEIYKILYDVFNDLYRIFPFFMMDIVPEYDDAEPSTHWATDDVQEVSSMMNLAVLTILDNLPSQTIRNVLLNYTEAMNAVYKGKPVRFSLRTLSEEYYRINNVIREMAYNESIYVI